MLLGNNSYAREYTLERSALYQIGELVPDSSPDLHVMGNDRLILNFNRVGQNEQVALINDKGETLLETKPTYFTVYSFNKEILAVQTEFKITIYNKNGDVLREIPTVKKVQFHQLYVLENNYIVGITSDAQSDTESRLTIFNDQAELVNDSTIIRQSDFGDYQVVLDADRKSFVLVSQNFKMNDQEGKIYRISIEGQTLSEATVEYTLRNELPLVMNNKNIFLTADNTRDCGSFFPITEKYYLYKVTNHKVQDVLTIKGSGIRLVYKFANENFLLYGQNKDLEKTIYFLNNEGRKLSEFRLENEPMRAKDDGKNNVNLFLSYSGNSVIKINASTGDMVKQISGNRMLYSQADGKIIFQADNQDQTGTVYDIDFNPIGTISISGLLHEYNNHFVEYKNGRVDLRKDKDTKLTSIYYSELK